MRSTPAPRNMFLLAAVVLALTPLNPHRALAKEFMRIDRQDHFVLGYKHRTRNSVLREYTPKGETVENWTELYTFSAYRKTTNASVGQVFKGFSTQLRKHCSKSSIKMLARKRDNGFATITFEYTCAIDKKTALPPEWGLAKIHIGTVDVFHTIKAWRQPPSQASWNDWLKRMNNTYICTDGKNARDCTADRDLRGK